MCVQKDAEERAPVDLKVIKSERAEQDRKYSKEELRKWVEDLPDDISGFTVCAIKQFPDGDVWTRSHAVGNTVADRFCALHLSIVEFMQFKSKQRSE